MLYGTLEVAVGLVAADLVVPVTVGLSAVAAFAAIALCRERGRDRPARRSTRQAG